MLCGGRSDGRRFVERSSESLVQQWGFLQKGRHLEMFGGITVLMKGRCELCPRQKERVDWDHTLHRDATITYRSP